MTGYLKELGLVIAITLGGFTGGIGATYGVCVALAWAVSKLM